MQYKKISIKEACVYISLFLLLSCTGNKSGTVSNVATSSKYTSLQSLFIDDLSRTVNSLDSIENTNNIEEIQKHYRSARKGFKTLEPILAFMDSENYKFLNQPNILKVEEEDATDVKIKEPTGFQVLEEEIFADLPDLPSIKSHSKVTSGRLNLIKNNIDFKFIKDYHVLWIIREQIIRTALTGITGFDSPVLQQSLFEAQTTYKALKNYLRLFKDTFNDQDLYQAWISEINNAILDLNRDFNAFDRYNFVKNHTHKSLELWKQTVVDWNVNFPFEKAIANNATSLYKPNTFNLAFFSTEKLDSLSMAKIELGEKLFYETALSSSNSISCATCHEPEKAFTDGLAISKGVTRNSPTLLYAALQKGFFYDNRVGSLEGQIVSVVNNKNEFHSDLQRLESTLIQDQNYRKAFKKAYNDTISQDHIRNAIATYIRSLSPFNSKFDRNINNLENTLTESEINGFNLFNGKAKCATCHFAPVFNGTVPVAFKETEMELIGVPETTDTINATIDDDLGRFNLFHTTERKHFFKTPTVRNIALTAPYMHNGVYKTLEEVIEFYNKGGGIGLGINLENQTLPPDPLNLSNKEIKDLMAFLNSLTDNPSY